MIRQGVALVVVVAAAVDAVDLAVIVVGAADLATGGVAVVVGEVVTGEGVGVVGVGLPGGVPGLVASLPLRATRQHSDSMDMTILFSDITYAYKMSLSYRWLYYGYVQ